MARLLSASVLALLLSTPAAAGAKGEAKPTPAKEAAKAAPAADPGDSELGSNRKVLEFDAEGNPKNPAPTEKPGDRKDEPLKKGEIALSEACSLRMTALLTTLKRCAKGTELDGFPLDSLVTGCGELSGKAPYSRKDAEACAKGISSIKCEGKFDPMNPASLNPEASVPGCKAVLAAERGGAGAKTSPGKEKGPDLGKPSVDTSRPGADFGSTVDIFDDGKGGTSAE